MKRWIIWVTVIGLAGVLLPPPAAANGHTSDEPPIIGPDYVAHPPASADVALADARKYYEEGSYAWAVAAAEEVSKRWPYCNGRPEADLIALRCYLKVERWEDADKGFDEYFRSHRLSPFAADAADLYVDAYSEGSELYASYNWQYYLQDKYGYNFNPGEKGRSKLDRKRAAVLKEAEGVYRGLMARAGGAERETLADRLVVNHLKMYPYVDWSRYDEKPAKNYDARAKHLNGVAKLEMGPNMRSMVDFEFSLLDLMYLTPPTADWKAAARPDPEYGIWLTERRLAAAEAKWSAMASEGATPGALLARSALAHYDVVYHDDPAAAAVAFDELADTVNDEYYARLNRARAAHLRAPTLAITGLEANAFASPQLKVNLACRILTDVNITVYGADATRYMELARSLETVELDKPAGEHGVAQGQPAEEVDTYHAIPTPQLPGVGDVAATWTVATGCSSDDFHIKPVETSRDELPPGLYVLEAAGGGEMSRSLFLLTKAAAVVANDNEQLFFQLVDAKTGAPVKLDGVTATNVFYKPDEKGYNKEIIQPVQVTPTAFGDGFTVDLTKYEKSSQIYFVMTSPLGPAIYQTYAGYDARPKTGATASVITDRPLYRPEAKVSYKGILRLVDYVEKTLAPAAGVKVAVEVKGPNNEDVWKGEAVTDEFGTCNGDFTLPPTAKLGTQYIYFKWKIGDKEYSGSGNFALEEYEKPEYEVAFTPSKDRYYSGEKISLDLAGTYFFGAPLSGAELTYEVFREGYGPKGYEYDKLLTKGSGALDAQGHFDLAFNTPYAKTYDNYISVNVKITDPSQRIIEGYYYVSTYATDRFVSVSTDKYEYRTDEAVKVTVYTNDWYSQPVPADVELAAYEYKWDPEKGYYRGAALANRNLRTDDDGNGEFVLELPNPAVGEVELTASVRGSNGGTYNTAVNFNFIAAGETVVRKPEIGVTVDNSYPKLGEDITLTLQSRFDDAECVLTIYSGLIAWVKHVKLQNEDEGSGATVVLPVDEGFCPSATIFAALLYDGAFYTTQSYFSVENTAARMNVKVESERADYRPGETAAVSVACTDPAGVPMAADMSLAVVDASLLALRGDQTYAVPYNFERSLDRYGYMRMENSLATRGSLGNAVFRFRYYGLYYGAYGANFIPADAEKWGPSAEVIRRVYLAELYNEALYPWLSLGDFDRLEPETYWSALGETTGMGLGYGEGRGGGGMGSGEGFGAVGGATTLRACATEADAECADALASPASKSAGKKFAEEMTVDESGRFDGNGGREKPPGPVQPQVRKEFLETAFWVPNLRADASGVAATTFKLPDNLTEWKVMALALDKGQRFGWGGAAFNVNKRIIGRLKAPRYFVAGDTARLTAQGHNYLKEPIDLTLEVKGEGLTFKEAATKTEKVDADGKTVLYTWVEAPAAGTAKLTVAALTNVESDAEEKILPIYPHGTQIRQAFAGRLRKEVSHVLTVVEGVAPSSFKGELIVTPSLAATLSHGLDYFKDYPYNCLEQTLNRFRVNAIMAAAAAALKLDQTKLADGLTAAIDDGVARVEETQTDAGGWPWWKGGRESAYMSAYAMEGLAELKGNPFVSPASAQKIDAMYVKGEKYLAGYFQEWRQDKDRYPAALSLYVVDVALRTGILSPEDDVTKEVADYYFDYRSPHNQYSLATLASVLARMGDEERLAVILRNLDNGAKMGADNTLHWGEDPTNCWYWWDDAVETTAKVLEVKLAHDPESPHLSYIVDWLVDQRRGAAWKSTKDSAAATTALMHYILAKPELAAPIVTAYKVGKAEGGMELDPTAYEKPGETAEFKLEDFVVGDNEMKLSRTSGDGPVFYTVALEYYAEGENIPAIQGSVTLSREYFIIQKKFKKGKPVEKRLPFDRPLKLGEELEVRLTVNSPYDFDYVVLEDPKPAGCVYVNTVSGYDWSLNAFVELWNKQRLVMFERLNAGETVVTYRLLGEVPGTYAALPARIWGMYSPDIGSNTASTTVTVEE